MHAYINLPNNFALDFLANLVRQKSISNLLRYKHQQRRDNVFIRKNKQTMTTTKHCLKN